MEEEGLATFDGADAGGIVSLLFAEEANTTSSGSNYSPLACAKISACL